MTRAHLPRSSSAAIHESAITRVVNDSLLQRCYEKTRGDIANGLYTGQGLEVSLLSALDALKVRIAMTTCVRPIPPDRYNTLNTNQLVQLATGPFNETWYAEAFASLAAHITVLPRGSTLLADDPYAVVKKEILETLRNDVLVEKILAGRTLNDTPGKKLVFFCPELVVLTAMITNKYIALQRSQRLDMKDFLTGHSLANRFNFSYLARA